MNRRSAIYEIITILRKFKYTDDDSLDETFIGFLVDEKRAKEIRDSYNRNPRIDPVWVQDYGIFDLTPVNYADDKELSFLKCNLYKATLPPVVSFSHAPSNTNNLGMRGIYSADLSNEYYYEDYAQFVKRLKHLSADHPAHLYQYYTQINRAIYATKGNKLRAQLILERPLDGFVLQTENVISGGLTLNDTFEVTEGQVTHNSVLYTAPATFVAVNPFFTGSGTVQYLNQKRKMTDLDEYPFSNSQMEIVIIKILAQELKIEESQAVDIRNNSSDVTNQAKQANA